MKTYTFKIQYNAIDKDDYTIHYIGRTVTITTENVNINFGEVQNLAVQKIFKLGCTAVEVTGIVKVKGEE